MVHAIYYSTNKDGVTFTLNKEVELGEALGKILSDHAKRRHPPRPVFWNRLDKLE